MFKEQKAESFATLIGPGGDSHLIPAQVRNELLAFSFFHSNQPGVLLMVGN